MSNPTGNPESSAAVNYQYGDDSSSFFDQLSPAPQDITQQGTPSQPAVTTTTDATLTPHPELTIPSSITVDQIPPQPSHSNLLMSHQSDDTTSESLTQTQELMKGSESAPLDEESALITSLPITSQHEAPVIFPPSQDISTQNMPDSHLTIPLTPQANLPTTEPFFPPNASTPETNNHNDASQSLSTSLTSVQSAMMMSMSTSMMAAATSPNASMDVEATTVKFQQASLNNDVYPNTQQLESYIANPGTVAIDNLSVSNPTSAGISTSTPPNDPKCQTSNIKPQISLGLTQESVPIRPKQNEFKLHKYFSTSKASNPFETIGGKSCNDSTMINPVYMSPTDSFNISNAIPSPDSFLTPATEQDVFTASLLSSDADRRHDAWIPQEATRQALLAMSSSPPGTYFPEKDLLTMPGIAVKEDFVRTPKPSLNNTVLYI